jgi:hydrogenase maturation protease
VSVLVLGIGNLVMSDDGIGVRVAQRLSERYRFPPGVRVVDGGTLGLDLLPMLEGVEKLLLLDAVETAHPVGTIVRLLGKEISIVMKSKLSTHQAGLQDLLLLADLLGYLPREIVLLGVRVEEIGLGMDLSEQVAPRLDQLVALALQELEHWGVKFEAAGEYLAGAAPLSLESGGSFGA